MEQKTSQGKYYVRARKERVLTWGRRVLEAAEKSPDVGRRYRCDICVSH